MPKLEIIQINNINGETKVLRTVKSYYELYTTYQLMKARGPFVRMRIDGVLLPTDQADSRVTKAD